MGPLNLIVGTFLYRVITIVVALLLYRIIWERYFNR